MLEEKVKVNRLSKFILLLAMTLLAAAGCGNFGGSSSAIRVGSKDFTEQFIIGNMYALLLENAGFKVERKLNLGGTPVLQQALQNGDVDLYPEYTGTGLVTVLKQPPSSDAQQVFNTVSQQYKDKF